MKSSITEPLTVSNLPLILVDIHLTVTWMGPVLALEVSVNTDPTLRRPPSKPLGRSFLYPMAHSLSSGTPHVLISGALGAEPWDLGSAALPAPLLHGIPLLLLSGSSVLSFKGA